MVRVGEEEVGGGWREMEVEEKGEWREREEWVRRVSLTAINGDGERECDKREV